MDVAIRLPVRGIVYAGMLAPTGLLWIALGPRGLVRVESFTDEAAFCHAIERERGELPEYRPDALAGVIRRLHEYFAGCRTSLDLPVDLGSVREFQRAVLEAVRAVPYGEVQSYRDIAITIGKPGAMRAVGAAVATNPISIVIPCHRVVRSDGTLGEYAIRELGLCGAHYKRMLLELEGMARAGG